MDQVIDLQFLVAHIDEVLEEAGRGATRFILKQNGRDDVYIQAATAADLARPSVPWVPRSPEP